MVQRDEVTSLKLESRSGICRAISTNKSTGLGIYKGWFYLIGKRAVEEGEMAWWAIYHKQSGTGDDLTVEHKHRYHTSRGTLESQLDHEFRIKVEEINYDIE